MISIIIKDFILYIYNSCFYHIPSSQYYQTLKKAIDIYGFTILYTYKELAEKSFKNYK